MSTTYDEAVEEIEGRIWARYPRYDLGDRSNFEVVDLLDGIESWIQEGCEQDGEWDAMCERYGRDEILESSAAEYVRREIDHVADYLDIEPEETSERDVDDLVDDAFRSAPEFTVWEDDWLNAFTVENFPLDD